VIGLVIVFGVNVTVHALVIHARESVVSGSITLLTWDIEDAGAWDGMGGGPFDDKLYIDGVEVAGAFVIRRRNL